MSHQFVLASLGPDIAIRNFGMTQWETGNYIGTWSYGLPVAIGAPSIVGGYCATEDETIKQITIISEVAPPKLVKVNIWLKTAGIKDWYKTKFSIDVSEDITHKVIGLNLQLGDRITFELEADIIWELGQGGLTIYGSKD